MAEHECRPEEGYGGIAAALRRAAPGDTVRLTSGTYEGAETLRLDTGVTLTGQGARLVHHGIGPAIEARGVADIAVEGVAIEVVAKEVPLRREPDGALFADDEEPGIDWGVVWFDAVAHGRIEAVSVTGPRSAHGICLRAGEGTHVSGCNIKGGARSGLILLQTRAGLIQENRCHGNAGAGIALFSSHAPEIAENECWENQQAGIVLQRDPDSPDASSDAVLRGSRCHGNTEDGITLMSSHSREIVANELWGNLQYGLMIAGKEGASQIGSLHENRIFQERTGIVVLHGTVLPSDLQGNWLWANASTSSWLVPHEEGYSSSTPLPVEFAGKPDVATATAQILVAEGILDPEALARFLDGPGCLHCLKDWWPADAVPSAPLDSNETSGRYLCRSEASRLHFRREAPGDGTAAIWTELERLATRLSGEDPGADDFAARLALVTADEAALEGLADEIGALRAAQAGRDVPSDLPPSTTRAIKSLRYGAIRVSAPVMLNHAPRSQAAMLGWEGLPPMFDAGLLEGRSRLVAALNVLVRTPKLWMAILGFPAALLLSAYVIGAPGTPPYWAEPIAALQRAFEAQIGDIQALDLVLLPGGVLAFFATVAALIRSSLPPALRWEPPEWMRRNLTVSDDTSSPAWRRWARRRIFERNIGIVVVRDAHEWSDRDMEDLRAVMALRPKGKALLVALHTPGRSQMDRAVLRPLAERPHGGGPDLQALDGLRLAIGLPPEPLDLTRTPDHGDEDAPSGSRLSALLGVKPDDEERLASLRGNVRDGKWSPSDILPMLVIGSTPDLPMQITRPRSERVTEFVPPLERSLLPFVRIFEADPHATLKLAPDESILRKVTEGEALRARAVHIIGRRKDGVEYMDLVGQPSRRQVLVDALVEAFDSIDARRDYVRCLLACGLLSALKVAMNAVGPKGGRSDLRRLLRALRAAGQLDAELTAAGGLDSVRQAMLDEAAAPLATAISTLRVPDDREARRLASLIACRADRMGLLDATMAGDSPELADTPVGVLGRRIATAASLRRKIDRSIAGSMITRYMHHELWEADEELRAKIEARLAGNSRLSTTLSNLIWKATDIEALHDLLTAHAAMGGQRTAILVQQLAGTKNLQIKLRAARAIVGLRSGGAGLVTPLPGSQRRVPQSESKVERLMKLVEDPSIHALLARKEDLDPAAEPFLDVELGYFDPADVEVQNVIDLVFED